MIWLGALLVATVVLEILRREIREYDEELARFPWKVVANKMDEPAAEAKGLKTRPPARYSEATLLGAMDDELEGGVLFRNDFVVTNSKSSLIENATTKKFNRSIPSQEN